MSWNYLGCVCFGGKWFQEIIFPQTRVFGSNGKWNFPENHFLLTKIYSFDPEMILHSHFHFKSFPEKEREREREREKREPRSERERGRRESQRLTRGAIVRRARRESRRLTSVLVDRNRRSRRSSDDRTDLASDLASPARSHLLLRCAISIWPNLMNFFVGFCFFCEWVWNWFIICMFTVEEVCGKLGM